jgi:tripartite-type tricarboxylate transporter receptor subunit TctC
MTKFMRAIALGVACLVSGSAFGQQYPNKPVKIIIPFPAGGVTDLGGRLIAQRLSEKLGQQFYIENVPGPAATSAWPRSHALRATATPFCCRHRASR